jgi:hypothetical protein
MNALAQYLDMLPRQLNQASSRYSGMNGAIKNYDQPTAQQDWEKQMQMANAQRLADLDAEDRQSQIGLRNRYSQSLGQMPNFYGEGPKMPEYQQQPMYQFGGGFGGFGQQRPMQGDNNAGAFNALAALARRGS